MRWNFGLELKRTEGDEGIARPLYEFAWSAGSCVGVFVVIIVVVNIWFVWPRFNDWGQAATRLAKPRKTLATYNKEIGQVKTYTRPRSATMESEGVPFRSKISPSNSQTTINSQARAKRGHDSQLGTRATGAAPTSFSSSTPRASPSSPSEAQLVDFLYKLGAGNSLIRVARSGSGPTRRARALAGNITLIASYQKKVRAGAGPRPGATKPPRPARQNCNANQEMTVKTILLLCS